MLAKKNHKKTQKNEEGEEEKEIIILFDIYGTTGNLNTGYFMILRNFYCVKHDEIIQVWAFCLKKEVYIQIRAEIFTDEMN